MDLFSPLSINKATFKNRTVMAPMVTNSAGTDGSVTSSYRDFFLARARGGVGYIVLGGAFVHQDGRGFSRQLGIHDDSLIPGLEHMVQAIREHAGIGIQLSFKGAGRAPESYGINDIKSYREAFASAALRARKCGFDAVELHACHDYWLNFFLSPYFNHRVDEYGGDLENRFRLLRETVQEIRSSTGDNLVLGVRLSLADFMDKGLGLEETLEIGRRLEDLGVDYLSASVGIGPTQFRMTPPMEVARSSELPLSRALQQSVNIPVIGVGRLDRPQEFRDAVEKGHVGMAAAARALIADPDFVLKIRENEEDRIRPCIACNYCLSCLQRGEEVRCVVNPYVGRDLMDLPPLSRPIKVVVVGAGPAGLSAAAAAAKRGARVKLMDKNPKAGGALNTAKLPPFKEVIGDFAGYLFLEAERSGVEMAMGSEVSAQDLAREEPDEIILATGARPLVPLIPGLESANACTAEEILRNNRVEGGDFLVMGGGLVGLETAEYLCEAGAKVTVLEMLDEMGRGLVPMRLKLIMDRLITRGANLLTRAKVLSVHGRMVEVRVPAGVITMGPYDKIILAAGYESDCRLLEALEDKAPFRVIGDAAGPRSILEAVSEGFEAALALKGKI